MSTVERKLIYSLIGNRFFFFFSRANRFTKQVLTDSRSKVEKKG